MVTVCVQIQRESYKILKLNTEGKNTEKKQSMRQIWVSGKRFNIRVIGVPKGEERETGHM